MNMNQRTITILVAVFILLVAGMFIFAYVQKSRLGDATQADNDDMATSTAYDFMTRVDAKHFYIDGTHTVAGEIMMPTACDLLESSAIVAESMPEQVTIDLNVINTAESCAQAMTAQRFLVSFDASEDAQIRAQLMGRDIDLNLVPAAEGEDPDDFELFIKG